MSNMILGSAGGSTGGSILMIVLYLAFFIGLMYFLMIRPQKKQQKKRPVRSAKTQDTRVYLVHADLLPAVSSVPFLISWMKRRLSLSSVTTRTAGSPCISVPSLRWRRQEQLR